MDGLAFFLDDAMASVMRGAVWVALGVVLLLAFAVFGALVLAPLCRALKDGQKALDGVVDAERRAEQQRAQWRAEGRNAVLTEREVRP